MTSDLIFIYYVLNFLLIFSFVIYIVFLFYLSSFYTSYGEFFYIILKIYFLASSPLKSYLIYYYGYVYNPSFFQSSKISSYLLIFIISILIFYSTNSSKLINPPPTLIINLPLIIFTKIFLFPHK